MAKIGNQGDGGGRPVKYSDVNELQALIDDYFKTDAYMGEGDNRIYAPTMSGLAIHLGMCRKTLLNYSNNDKFLHAIKKAREKIGAALEQRLYSHSVAGVIFNLKNNFGWQDKREIEHSGGITLEADYGDTHE